MSLEALFTNHEEIEVKDGVKIKIKDVSLSDVPLVTKVIHAFISQDGETASRINNLMTNNLRDVVKLISVLTDIPEKDVNKLSLDSTIIIISKIIEKNIVFIKKNIVPTVQSLASELTKTGSELSKN